MARAAMRMRPQVTFTIRQLQEGRLSAPIFATRESTFLSTAGEGVDPGKVSHRGRSGTAIGGQAVTASFLLGRRHGDGRGTNILGIATEGAASAAAEARA